MAIETIDGALCTGCGFCARSCPMDVIRMDKESHKACIKYAEDCMLCGICLEECPKKAIHLVPDKPVIMGWG
jgi:Pyruvate/2-oxoacid:ferredoxin oxidoreductase delta subunit